MFTMFEIYIALLEKILELVLSSIVLFLVAILWLVHIAKSLRYGHNIISNLLNLQQSFQKTGVAVILYILLTFLLDEAVFRLVEILLNYVHSYNILLCLQESQTNVFKEEKFIIFLSPNTEILQNQPTPKNNAVCLFQRMPPL